MASSYTATAPYSGRPNHIHELYITRNSVRYLSNGIPQSRYKVRLVSYTTSGRPTGSYAFDCKPYAIRVGPWSTSSCRGLDFRSTSGIVFGDWVTDWITHAADGSLTINDVTATHNMSGTIFGIASIPTGSFVTDRIPPRPTVVPPGKPNKPGVSSITSDSACFTLTGLNDGGAPATWVFQIADNPNFINAKSFQRKQDCEPRSALKPGTKYWVRAKGTNSAGSGIWSDITEFTTKADPSQFGIEAALIAIGSTDLRDVAATWKAITGATRYIYQWSSSADMTENTGSKTVSSNTLSAFTDMNVADITNDFLYVRVKALLPSGDIWSPIVAVPVWEHIDYYNVCGWLTLPESSIDREVIPSGFTGSDSLHPFPGGRDTVYRYYVGSGTRQDCFPGIEVACTPGQLYATALEVSTSDEFGQVKPTFAFFDADRKLIQQVQDIPSKTPVYPETYVAHMELRAPGNATYMRLGVYSVVADQVIGSSAYLDKAIIRITREKDIDYFDGDSGNDYKWVGERDSSYSIFDPQAVDQNGWRVENPQCPTPPAPKPPQVTGGCIETPQFWVRRWFKISGDEVPIWGSVGAKITILAKNDIAPIRIGFWTLPGEGDICTDPGTKIGEVEVSFVPGGVEIVIDSNERKGRAINLGTGETSSIGHLITSGGGTSLHQWPNIACGGGFSISIDVPQGTALDAFTVGIGVIAKEGC